MKNSFTQIFANNIHAQLDAFIADEHSRPGNELAHFVLALATERAIKRTLAVAAGGFRHRLLSLSETFGLGSIKPTVGLTQRPGPHSGRLGGTFPDPGPNHKPGMPSCLA